MLPGRRQDKKKLQPSVRFTHCWTIVEIIVCRHHTFFQGNKWVQNRLYRLKNGSPVKFYLSNPIKWRDLLDEGFFTYPDFSFKHLKNQRKTPDSSFQQILFYCDQSSYVMVIFAFFLKTSIVLLKRLGFLEKLQKIVNMSQETQIFPFLPSPLT